MLLTIIQGDLAIVYTTAIIPKVVLLPART